MSAQTNDVELGRIYIPKDFVHGEKDYKKGIYYMTLTEKDGQYTFNVLNRKKEPLFQERAVVVPDERKGARFKFRIKKEMLKGYEYFRVMVIQPKQRIIAYFLIKQKEQTDIEE